MLRNIPVCRIGAKQLPDGSGQVDLLLAKDGKAIAIEICSTTNPDWKMHNISKCIKAGYTHIISLSGDIKQLERIRKKCSTSIADFEKQPILFFIPNALISFLDASVKEQIPDEVNMKGYRINVFYDDVISNEEVERKRASISNVIRNTLRKNKKKE